MTAAGVGPCPAPVPVPLVPPGRGVSPCSSPCRPDRRGPFVGDAARSVLLDRDRLALVALTPRSAYIVAAAWDVPCPLLLLVAVARLSLADPVHFVLGREAGPSVLARAERTRVLGRLARRLPPTPDNLWVSAVGPVPHGQVHVRGRRPGAPGGAGRCRQRGGHGRPGPGRVDGGAGVPVGGRDAGGPVRLGGGTVWRGWCGSARRPPPIPPARRGAPPGRPRPLGHRSRHRLRESPCGRPAAGGQPPALGLSRRRRTRPRRETT